MIKSHILGAVLVVAFGAAAHAEVTSIGPQGFELRHAVHVALPPEKVYEAFAALPKWWDPTHTFFGKGENLSLDLKAGGCFCEVTPKGEGVEHARVSFLAPGQAVRLRGALGPMQGMGMDGALTWSFKAAGNETDVIVENAMGGYSKDGFEALAKIVDMVVGQQLSRLKAYAETGNPVPAKPAPAKP
ncbi:MAG: SRPBCC domain-containing protein [Rhodospirillaceae bacterium]|nr:SRPBCC domain-containing protein [Rhodospirillaceae bacterium]